VVDAGQAFVAVERTRPASAEALRVAIDERARAGEDLLPISVVSVPGRYVAGEESALVHWLNGGDAKPTTVPPRPFERGVAGRPTLIQNVETLAHLALIGRFGPTWFRTLGPPDEPGSTLMTAAGAVVRPGVCEIAIGTRIGDLLDAAGGPASELTAVLVGGYFGTWIPIADALDVRLSSADLRRVGASLGCGVVAALPVSACPLVETARVLQYLAEETAGQCGPCVFGLAAMSDGMNALARGDAGRTILQDLDRWSGLISRRGACHHPDGATRFLRSALAAFPEEIALHRHARCRATSSKPVLAIPTGRARDLGWR
jgi:NADH:ubiquinone oxidoreductase subunit F (NADH-binding)